MLTLQDLYADQVNELPSLEGRLAIDYEAQLMPMLFGPMGTFLPAGVVVEYGTAINRRGRCICPVIVSLAREITLDSSGGSSLEREQEHIGQLASKIRPLIFSQKSCPIYEFAEDQAGIVGIVDYADWHDELYTNVMTTPKETVVGNFEPGGWLRSEFTFSVAYRIQES
jgi:hypothetical protein